MKANNTRNKQGITETQYLEKYDASLYKRPSVTVDMTIFTIADKAEQNYRKLPEKVLKILMVKRGEHPYLGKWALPGGFASVDESLDEAAFRELKSETNVESSYMEQLYTWGEVHRDPRTRVISTSYMALLDSAAMDIKAGDDAEAVAWFEVRHKLLEEKKIMKENGYVQERIIRISLISETEELHSTVKITAIVEGRVKRVNREVIEAKDIAFDHSKIIEYAIERLRNKIEYSDIAFNLMPELFTLTELQQVYEVILDKELLAAAFRRKVEGLVIETNQIKRDAGHRPSKLYRYQPI